MFRLSQARTMLMRYSGEVNRGLDAYEPIPSLRRRRGSLDRYMIGMRFRRVAMALRQYGELPRLFGVEPPRPRLEAVRIVGSSNSWAVFAENYRH